MPESVELTRRVFWGRQPKGEDSCGPRVIRMVANYLRPGIKLVGREWQRVRCMTMKGGNGTKKNALMAAIKALGLRADLLPKKDLMRGICDAIRHDHPVIAWCWVRVDKKRVAHYVVLRRIDKTSLYLCDPLMQVQEVRPEAFVKYNLRKRTRLVVLGRDRWAIAVAAGREGDRPRHGARTARTKLAGYAASASST